MQNVHPRHTKLIFAVECKYYFTNLGINLARSLVVTPIDLLMVKFTFYKRSNNLIVHLFAFRKTNGFSY
ncbi:hypothetical protein [Photobacterium damselae]|uniref:hypothetical protein n=1 Tax=Photobacterium damselae TaxID=38293 RepID=UPI000F792EB2|nr:hypothetical protein [Photobacterium damselae]